MPISTNERRWMIQSSNGTSGPYSLEQLRELASKKLLHRSTAIREVGSLSWIVAGQLPVIFTASEQLQSRARGSAPSLPAKRPEAGLRLPAYGQNVNSGVRPSSSRLSPTMLVASAVVLLSFLVLLAIVLSPRVGTNQASGNAAAQPASNSDQQLTTEELVNRTKASVATIQTPLGIGSGFAIDEHLIVTNYHVIADAPSDSINAYFPDSIESKRGPFPVRIVCEQPLRDLAILSIDIAVPPVAIDTSHAFRRGQDVVIIGSPLFQAGGSVLANAVSKGVLSSETNFDGQNYYQLSLAVNPGNSGGPVFGMDGRAIGVVAKKSLVEEAISFCIPASDLTRLIRSQSAKEFQSTSVSIAEHDARRIIHRVASQCNNQAASFECFVDSIQSEHGFNPANSTTVEFVRFVINWASDNDLMTDHSDHSDALASLDMDSRLSDIQRMTIARLHEQYQLIQQTIDQPPNTIEGFMKSLILKTDSFFEQLDILRPSLELGEF